MCQTKSVSKSRGGWWADCWRGEGEHKPAYPYMQREEVSRREGRGHTGFLYSHRYRGGISIAALQKMGEKERREEDRERARASYFSDVESACAWDVCVYRVGNISRPRSYLQKALFIKRELRPCRLKSNQRRKFSWFVLKGLTS